jgi:hypothetical protein
VTERAPLREPYDDWADLRVGRLYEGALRLLAALGEEPAFPGHVEGAERLIDEVAEGKLGEVMDFAIEDPGGLPRFSGEHLFWVRPRSDGRIRLRAETFGWSATSVVVSPDGRLTDFVAEEGFGVPDSQLTEQALADRETVERLRREAEADDVSSKQRREEDQRRFRTQHLCGVSAAPWQDPEGLVITWLAFYETGIILSHLLPRSAEPRSEGEEDRPGEALWLAARPEIQVTDDLGNRYEELGAGHEDVSWPLLRATREFGPAVARGASRVVVRSEWGSVDIEVRP